MELATGDPLPGRGGPHGPVAQLPHRPHRPQASSNERDATTCIIILILSILEDVTFVFVAFIDADDRSRPQHDSILTAEIFSCSFFITQCSSHTHGGKPVAPWGVLCILSQCFWAPPSSPRSLSVGTAGRNVCPTSS